MSEISKTPEQVQQFVFFVDDAFESNPGQVVKDYDNLVDGIVLRIDGLTVRRGIQSSYRHQYEPFDGVEPVWRVSPDEETHGAFARDLQLVYGAWHSGHIFRVLDHYLETPRGSRVHIATSRALDAAEASSVIDWFESPDRGLAALIAIRSLSAMEAYQIKRGEDRIHHELRGLVNNAAEAEVERLPFQQRLSAALSRSRPFSLKFLR